VIIEATTPEERNLADRWLSARIPGVDGVSGPYAFLAVLGGDGVQAVVSFHDYQERCGTIQITMAADTPRWATRANLKGLLAYPFKRLGVNKIWTATPLGNAPAITFNERLGMKREAVLRHQFGPRSHAVIMSMMKAEYLKSRWV
jgi:RimJ/RimL family protein N-acetyltransferase